MSYYDEQLSPKPDRHGQFAYPLDSTALVNPYGDDHTDGRGVPYPQNSSGDVHPAADDHNNQGFQLHEGTPKPGSFKGEVTSSPKQPPVL